MEFRPILSWYVTSVVKVSGAFCASHAEHGMTLSCRNKKVRPWKCHQDDVCINFNTKGAVTNVKFTYSTGINTPPLTSRLLAFELCTGNSQDGPFPLIWHPYFSKLENSESISKPISVLRRAVVMEAGSTSSFYKLVRLYFLLFV